MRGGRAAITHPTLMRRVAEDTGVHIATVRKVTDALVWEMKRALLEDGSFQLNSFGQLSLALEQVRHKDRKGPPAMARAPIRVKILMRKSPVFKKEAHQYIKDGIMEKYGVDESVDQRAMEKAASEGCPLCGKPVVKHGSVIMCPTHGTEPFERKEPSR